MAEEKTTATKTKVPAAAEQLYLLSALVEKEESMALLKKITSSKAKIEKEEILGKKELAYPINKHSELVLLSIFLTAEPSKIKELEKELSTEEKIERFLITSWSAEIPKDSERNSKKSTKREES